MRSTPLPPRLRFVGFPVLSLLALLTLTGCGPRTERAPAPAARPNIVLIVADDAGYGDFGVQGQRRFETPNIDRLATEGIRFTQFYAGSTVCAPSRSTLMTGLHTGHTEIRGNPASVAPPYALPPGRDLALSDSVVTLAETLQAAGYRTGAFGKWGLGPAGSPGAPGRQGIDRFYGYLSHRAAHYYYPESLWADGDSVPIPENEDAGMRSHSHELIHREAMAFLDANQGEPFFLYLPYTIPHAELLAPDDSVLARFTAAYGEAPRPEAARNRESYGRRYAIPSHPRAARAAMLTHLDRAVGDILRKLEEMGIDDNTIVLFTSDNGPSREAMADLEFFDSNGPFRGIKRDLYEGGIRVPLLVRWPDRIAPGQVSDHVAAFWDVLPTLAEVAGASSPAGLDGISFLPSLTGTGGQREHEYLYWEFSEQGGKQAVRRGDWKAVRLDAIESPGRPLELYDLARDPAEEHDVAARHPEVVRELEALMASAHAPSALFPGFD